jgi:sporulation protein YlmC with PRC-barrel domain
MRLSEIIGSDVVSADGTHVGRVVELRCSGEPERGEERRHRVVTELSYGRVGWLERMGFRAVREQVIPWADISSIEEGRVVLKK